jgi:hypothetical protein
MEKCPTACPAQAADRQAKTIYPRLPSVPGFGPGAGRSVRADHQPLSDGATSTAQAAQAQMSQVVGLDRKPVDVRTAQMDMADAATALRLLLEKIDSGEVKMVRWMILYDKPIGDGNERTAVQDSSITVEKAIYMVECAKHIWMRNMFGEPHT